MGCSFKLGDKARIYYRAAGTEHNPWPVAPDSPAGPTAAAVTMTYTVYGDNVGAATEEVIEGSGGLHETLLGNVRDVTVSSTEGTSDVTTRQGNGWRQLAPTLKEGTVTTSMIWDLSDPGLKEVIQAKFDPSARCLPLLVCDAAYWAPDAPAGFSADDAASYVSGLWGTFVVTDFERTEELENALMANVTFQLTRSTQPPQWIEGIRTA